jgi:DNA mismatch repair protein MutS
VHAPNLLLEDHGAGLASAGLRRLHEALRQLRGDLLFIHHDEEFPGHIEQVRGIASTTVGTNLDQDLQPVEVAPLTVGTRRFKGAPETLLSRLFGESRPEQGVGPLHRLPVAPGSGPDGEPWRVRPMLVPLFRDLSDVLSRVCRPVARALQRYLSLNTSPLVRIGRDLAFYLGAVTLLHRPRELGLPTCRTRIVSEVGVCRLRELYNPNLAFRLAESTDSKLTEDEAGRCHLHPFP